MPIDTFAPKGSTKASRPDAGKANLRDVPVLATVKDNVDPIRAGRLQVYIDDMGGSSPDDRNSWMTVSYMTPFYGLTDASGGDNDHGDFKANPSSYGMWYSPPDIGSVVICLFINGDPNFGYWIGCVPKPEALYMVPAIGSSDNIITGNQAEADGYGGATRLPVTNMNTNNAAQANSADFLKTARPVHSYQAMIMNQQGIIRDPIRGTIGTSSQRESPSRVGWGVSSPGRPIYSGGYDDSSVASKLNASNNDQLKVVARRGGHSIIMDDGDLIGNDQVVRIRTALGHQILMSDNGQTLMILHSNGQSYIELGKEGTIDMYSMNSVNIRTQGDLNLHADNNININAKKKLSIYAESMEIETEKETLHKVGTDYNIQTKGTHTHKVTGPMSMASSGEASFASSAVTYINGSKINLNTGATGTTPADVKSLTQLAQTDTLYDKQKGFMAAPGKLLTIVSRAPAHAPWANAGQGVDVKTNIDAGASLPPAPNSAVAATNKSAGPPKAGEAITPANASTVPDVKAASTALDKNTTSALVSATAVAAANGPAAAAIAGGAGVANIAGVSSAVIGAAGLTPAQLQAAGTLKPGSATLINGLVAGGANVQAAMTNNLFTGQAGASSLTSLVNNTTAQAGAVVNNLQSAQSALTSAGVMTGAEAPGAVAGMVLSGATAGVGNTISAIQSAASNPAGALTSAAAGAAGAAGAAANALAGGAGGAAAALTGGAASALGSAGSAVTNAISSGNFAAGLSQTGMGGLGSISSSLSELGKATGLSGVMDAAKGVAASAFDAVKNGFKSFQVGVPQNLTSIAANATKALKTVTGVGSTALDGATGGITDAAGALGAGAASLTGANSSALLGGASNALNAVTGAASNALGGVTGLVTGAAGGLTTGASALLGTNASTLISGAGSALNSVTGAASNALGGVTGLVTGAASKLPGASALAAAASGGINASSLASGLGALPTGSGAVSTIVNNAAGAATSALGSVPGVSSVTSLINNSSTAALTGGAASLQNALASGMPSTDSLTASAGGLLESAKNGTSGLTTGLADKLKSGTDSLSGLASTGLSADAATALQTSMSSLSSAGPVPIQLPTVASNTNDRSTLDGQIGNLVGPGVPTPNFSGSVSPSATAAYDAVKARNQAYVEAVNELIRKQRPFRETQRELLVAEQQFPPGDPQIAAAEQKYEIARKEYRVAKEAAEKLEPKITEQG
jgi:hypothetical protein